MTDRISFIVSLLAVLGLSACGKSDGESVTTPETAPVANNAPLVTFKPSGESEAAGKPSGPISVSYRIIGKPVIGQPVAIDLRVSSALGAQPIKLDYRVNDSTAMQLAEAQPASIMLPAKISDRAGLQQVSVIPMREGRLYLNVSASIETEDGSISTVTAIPIQVGDAPRVLQQNGEVQMDADGNLIRVMPAKED